MTLDIDRAMTTGPLSGIRVIEFDAIGPFLLCAMLLADMANVVLITRRSGQTFYEDLGETILNRRRMSTRQASVEEAVARWNGARRDVPS